MTVLISGVRRAKKFPVLNCPEWAAILGRALGTCKHLFYNAVGIVYLHGWLCASLTHDHNSNKSPPFVADKWVSISSYIVWPQEIVFLDVSLFLVYCLSLIVSMNTFWSTSLFLVVRLTSCSFSGNKITDKGVCAVATALQVNKSLQRLKWVIKFLFLRVVHWD